MIADLLAYSSIPQAVRATIFSSSDNDGERTAAAVRRHNLMS
jgi:hypothetical protein